MTLVDELSLQTEVSSERLRSLVNHGFEVGFVPICISIYVWGLGFAFFKLCSYQPQKTNISPFVGVKAFCLVSFNSLEARASSSALVLTIIEL